MKFSDDLRKALPGADWQRIETWAAIAGLSTGEYLALCIRRGHDLVKEDLKSRDTLLATDMDAVG